ncbi:CHAT domain protein [Ceratobasidium sp. AG-Ba]|nr:CHAT domain protein [Ceratobasidium sp. AG-Ba]QRW10350.1 CHAT domain protein [Ceratobasidium sp. AG-Ba]
MEPSLAAPAPQEVLSTPSSPQVGPFPIPVSEALDRIRNIPDPNQAMVILAGFWELVPQGRVFELTLFDLYLQLRKRQLENLATVSESREGVNWEQQYLSQRIAILATTLKDQFQRTNQLARIERSILCFREAVAILPDNFEDKAAVFANFGVALHVRFLQGGNISDSEESLFWLRRAVSLTSSNDLLFAQRSRNLAIALSDRFRQLEQIDDLEEAITNLRKAVANGTEDPDSSIYVHDLGVALRHQYDRSGQPEQIAEAIECHKHAASSIPDTDSHFPERLNALGMAYSSRYHQTNNESDLENARVYHERALSMTPEDDPDKAARLNNLGSIFQMRFARFNDLHNLEKAIILHQTAVDLTPENHANKPSVLRVLAISVSLRFEYLGDLNDIDTAISLVRRALTLAPTRTYILSQLGRSLLLRFRRTDHIDDLTEAIDVQTHAISLSSNNNLYIADYSRHLGEAFLDRYERFGDREDINHAIACGERAVRLTPDEHASRPRRLDFLATALSSKFEIGKQVEDIEKAVSIIKELVARTPDGGPSKPRWLDSLGCVLAVWFDHTGKLAHLDEAIRYSLEAVSLTPDNHQHKPALLVNLGKSLLARFEYLHEPTDADRSISTYQLAMNLTPNNHSGMAALLTGFGHALHTRFKISNLRSDLEDAIQSYRAALALTPPDHAIRPARLSNLGGLLMDSDAYFNERLRLEEAISFYHETVALTKSSNPRLPFWFNHLGLALLARYRHNHTTSDLAEARTYLEKSVALGKDTEPTKATWLRNLASAIKLGLEEDPGNWSDKNYLLDTLMKASQLATGNPETRLSAACELAYHSSRFGVSSLEAYAYAFEIMPTFIWMGKTIRNRHHGLSYMQNLASEAAAEAIKQQRYELAIEWLEQGRSVVWGQILKLRQPLDRLRAVDPALADRLEEASVALDRANTELPSNTDANIETARRAQHQLANEWEGLVQRARNLAGFERFLMPLSFQTLVQAAHSSTVVVINVHATGCDALAIVPGSRSVLHVPLPRVSSLVTMRMRQALSRCLRASGVRERGFKKVVTGAQDANQFQGALSELWSDVVMPILDRLGYLVSKVDDDALPRITWCATGSLAFLPLHAAGVFGLASTGTFDYVISSYTPTLSALLTIHPSPSQFQGILAVGQASTQGMSELPGTKDELDRIEAIAAGFSFKRLEGRKAICASVLDGMQKASWVHLACHASQNTDDPTCSAFYLYDAPLDLATISSTPFKHASFAFLSACQTATGVEDLPEEAIHLAAGMLMSGYPSVIATMWSVRDQDAPTIAEQ